MHDSPLERVGFEPVVPPLVFLRWIRLKGPTRLLRGAQQRIYRAQRQNSSLPSRGWSNQTRTAGPIRFSAIAAAGSRIPTASRSSTSVHSPTIRFTTLGGQYRRHQYRLERLSALVLNDHAYDKLTGWSNVIPVVPVKGDATETYKFIKEESHGPRSTPHRHRS